MQKAQVSRALKIVATIDGGRNVIRDREELLKRINSVRQMLWINESFREGAMRTDGCSVVEIFREDCRNCSCTPTLYTGIVLPPLVCNLTEIMKDGREVELQFGRIDPEGCAGACRSCMVAEELPKRLLERDVPMTGQENEGRVVFRNEDPADEGTITGVRYVDFEGREHREDLMMSQAGVVTEVSVLRFLEITFPERCGWFNVKTEHGVHLGRYHPSIWVPAHEHYRINGTSAGDLVNWRGLQEPYDLVFDSDPVEFSDDPKWRICLQIESSLSQAEMTAGQRAGIQDMERKLAAFFSSDLSARNKNFTGRAMPRNRGAMFATAAKFSGQRRFVG